MQKQSFNRDWRFHIQDTKVADWWRRPDTSAWPKLDLPHDWSPELPRNPESLSRYSVGYFRNGRGVYLKTFNAPEEWRGKKVFIEFEGVYMNAEVWLNEHYLGRHPFGYTSFQVDLSESLRIGEENTLKVQVDNAAEPNSRWYSGSGIYRPVWLIVAEPLHLAHWGVYVTTPEVTAQAATVRVQTSLENESADKQEVTLRSRILGPDGQLAASAEAKASLAASRKHKFTQQLSVNAPSLWSVDSPLLYTLESEVHAGGKLVDSAVTTFGIRTIEFDAVNGFRLNGKMLKLKGGCVHHDNGVLGATVYPRAEERKVEIHKASGYNAIRCAHNPPSPAFLEACDRLGMLVIDEAFDCWRDGKNPYDYHVAFDDWWQRDLDSMVLRDRNHPCVILWSVGNEVAERDGRSQGAEIARMLAERVREVDPTRPVTSAICGVWDKDGRHTWQDTDAVFAAMDVGGYNYQWKQYLSDHDRHPQRMMVGLESTPGEALETWTLVEEKSYILGDFVWTSLDYLGEAGIGRVVYGDKEARGLGDYPWNQANCGDLDLCGFKRPQSYYRDLLWGVGTQLYIAVHDPSPDGTPGKTTYWGWPEVWPNWTWPGREGQTFKVDVYSACESVELFLNGRSLGVQPATRAERLTASFEVPYEPGELKAVGLKGGKAAAETSVKTASAASAIRLTPDRAELNAAGDDLSYVTVEIVDDAGMAHPAADRTVYFTLQGEGSIAAVGSANPATEESYRGNQRATYRGRALVVVKTNGQAGDIRLRAQADGLAGTEVVLTAK